MWKNSYKQEIRTTKAEAKGYRDWNVALEWLLSSKEKSPLYEGFQVIPVEAIDRLGQKAREAEEAIAHIKDPLWQRVCLDMLKILGPTAFNGMWNVSFISVSPNKKVAYLICPTLQIAETLDRYQFVVVEAFKKFYPLLTSLDVEVKEKELPAIECFLPTGSYC